MINAAENVATIVFQRMENFLELFGRAYPFSILILFKSKKTKRGKPKK